MNIVEKFKIQTYNVGFINKGIDKCLSEGLGQGDIAWLKHHYRDRFFADPFLFDEDNEHYYILCEELTFWEEKGRITCLKVKKKTLELIDRWIVIDEPYHLSFPFCELDSDWVIPEACKSGKTYAYRIDKQTYKIQEKKVILNEGLIDNVYYRDECGNVFLYAGHTRIPSTELFEYKLDKNGSFSLTQTEPIESNNRTTRGAGRFFRLDDTLYRPVQDCLGRYGKQTKILKFNSPLSKGYNAEDICTLNSFSNPPFSETFHTFNVYADIIVVDGSRDFVRFPAKIFYKKAKCFFKRRKL